MIIQTDAVLSPEHMKTRTAIGELFQEYHESYPNLPDLDKLHKIWVRFATPEQVAAHERWDKENTR